MITTTATDIQNNFGKYLKAVQEGNEIIILKKGKEVVDYQVENALLASALDGNTTAQIFWLKNRKFRYHG